MKLNKKQMHALYAVADNKVWSKSTGGQEMISARGVNIRALRSLMDSGLVERVVTDISRDTTYYDYDITDKGWEALKGVEK